MSTATAEQGPDLSTFGPGQLFDYLWGTKYAPEMAEAARRESERRADAFVDGATFNVCGEEIRLMTPRDLLMLDGFENAFVCAAVPTPEDLQWFLWVLSVQNNGSPYSWRNRWRKGRCYARVALREDFEADAGEVYAYLDRLWLDEPAAATKDEAGERKARKPATVYCLAPLLVNVAGSVGSVDPMSGQLLAHTPIPRLLQYQRAAIERKTGEQEATSFDSQRSRCLEEVNNIMAARRAK
jgi:hypothetical protein